MNKTYQILMTVLIATVAITAQIPNNGLVAFYPFNGTCNDESDNALSTVLVRTPVLAADHNGTANSAYLLDGNNQGFKVLNAGKLPTGNPDLTITTWFLSKKGGIPRTIVSWGADTNGIKNKYEITFYKASIDGCAYLGITNGVDSVVAECPTSESGNWFFAAVKISSGNVTFYMNGTPTTSKKIAFDIKSGGTFSIGTDISEGDPSGSNNFGGNIDDVTIYNRALSDGEITYIKTCKGSRNLAPSITSTAVTKGKALESYYYKITATDPENQNITVTASVKPSGMTLSGNDLRWTPTTAQVGSHQVSIKVKDSVGDSIVQTFTIVVEASTSVSYKVATIKTKVSLSSERLYSPNGRLYQKNVSGIALSKNHSRLMIK